MRRWRGGGSTVALRRAWRPEGDVRPARHRFEPTGSVTAGLSSAGRRWPGSDGDDPARIAGGSQRRVHSRNTRPHADKPLRRRVGRITSVPGRGVPAENASAGVRGPVIVLTVHGRRIDAGIGLARAVRAAVDHLARAAAHARRSRRAPPRPTTIEVNTLSRTPKKCSAGSIAQQLDPQPAQAVGDDVEGEGPAVAEPEPAVGPDDEGSGERGSTAARTGTSGGSSRARSAGCRRRGRPWPPSHS